LAVHLAEVLSRLDKSVLLVDADPQGSALDWAANRPDDPRFPVIGLPKPTLHRELPAIAKNHDFVLIDGPPRVNELARAAIMASDVVLIPVQPSPFDVWAAKEIVDLLREASAFKENIKSAFVINRKIVNTAIGRDVVEALSSYPLPVLKTSIGQRVAFAECAAQGLTVLHTDPNGPASQEIVSLAKELLEL
ncbi:MAG: cobyrinic acid a,c-diamide synthase, partial [Clostridia bacterium]|nr:cobyrinic acid a,c-diamide synthase [Clostridia bacterium]